MKIPSSNLERTCCVQKLFLTFWQRFTCITSRHALTCLDMSRNVLLFFEWQELIRLHHIVSYEYLRIIIWHGLNLENFQNLDNLENLEHFENWLVRAFTSDLGLNAFESCSFRKMQSVSTKKNIETPVPKFKLTDLFVIPKFQNIKNWNNLTWHPVYEYVLLLESKARKFKDFFGKIKYLGNVH